MHKKFTKFKYGFTIVETLVAISILSVSILATFTAVQGSLKSSILVKDEITAFYLTQEAMEYIKNIRDQNALESLDGTAVNGHIYNWLSGLVVTSGGLAGPCNFGRVCSIDSPLKSVVDCGAAGVGSTPPNICSNLTQQTSSSLYGHTTGAGWVTSNFKREIQFESINNKEVRVIISVRWTTGGTVHFFQTRQLLFNRQ